METLGTMSWMEPVVVISIASTSIWYNTMNERRMDGLWDGFIVDERGPIP